MIWGYPHDFGTPHIVKWVVVYWHPKHIFHDISWYFMIFHDISIYFMIFHDISWYFMIFHDISWYFMIFHDISWYFMYHLLGFSIITFHFGLWFCTRVTWLPMRRAGWWMWWEVERQWNSWKFWKRGWHCSDILTMALWYYSYCSFQDLAILVSANFLSLWYLWVQLKS